MKVIVFGSTGRLGKAIVEKCLEEGMNLTAFARNIGKLNDLEHPRLNKMTGDIFSKFDLDESIQGHDIAIIALGDGGKGFIRSAGTKCIVDSLRKNGVKKLICMSTMGIGSSGNHLNFFWKYIMFGLLLKKAFKDHENQEKIVMESGLEYAIIRPSAFSKIYPTGYQIIEDDYRGKLKLKISLKEIAEFVVNIAKNDVFENECITISS